MPNIVRPTELTNAVRTLLGYVDDLRRAPQLHEGATKLRLVVNYCQKDPVVRALSEQLRGRVSTEALHERTSGDALRPPEDPRDRLAFWHTLLYHVKQGWKLELRELVTRAFHGGGVEDRFRAFLAQVVGGYAAGLEQVLARLEARADEGATVDADEAFREALAALAGGEPVELAALAGSGADAAPAPTASAAVPSPPAAPDLLAAIDDAALPAEEAQDLRVDAHLLAIELRKHRPSPARLAELERSFVGATPALGAAFRGALGGEIAYAPAHGGASVREADARRAHEEHGDEDATEPDVGARPAKPASRRSSGARPVKPAARNMGAQPAAPATVSKKKKATAKKTAAKKTVASKKAATTTRKKATKKAAPATKTATRKTTTKKKAAKKKTRR